MSRLRYADNLSVDQHRGVIICDPDGRNGGGYVVRDRLISPALAANRVRKAVAAPALEPISGSDLKLRKLSLTQPLFARLVAVSRATGISVDEMRGIRRHKPTVYARAAFSVLAVETWTASLPAIGRALGGMDHTTILYHVRAHSDTPAVRSIVNRAKILLGMPDHDA